MFGKRVPYSRALSWLALAILELTSASWMSGTTSGSSHVYLPIITSPLTPIIPDTTHILSQTTTQHLVSVSEDGSVFTFNQMTPELEAVAVGEVIVSEPTAITPAGFLRRVMDISDTGGQVVFITVQATLEEAIQQGEVHVHHVLSPEDLQSGFLPDGVTLVQQPDQPEGEFHLEINNVVIHDEDGNPDTTDDQIVANGSITLELEFDFDFAIQDWHLEELHFITTAEETAELTIVSKVEESLLEAEVIVANYPLTAITVWAGPFPVIIMPLLKVSIGANGSIHVGVTAGVTQETSLTAGLRYEEGDWQQVNDFDSDFSYDLPTVKGGMNMKTYAAANLDLLLYGGVGPYTKIELSLQLEADPLATPWWRLYGGLEVPVGIEIEIFSHTIISFSAKVIDERIWLAQTESPTGVQLIGSYGSPGASDVVVNNDLAYIANIEEGLQIVDVSDPTNPQGVGSYDTFGHAVSVAVDGNYAYIADGYYGVKIISISNPTNPQQVGVYGTPGFIHDVAVRGSYIYSAGGLLYIASVASPTNPQTVSSYDTPGDARGVALSGNYAYVADYFSGLRIIDISNPANPHEVGFYDTSDLAKDVAVSGNYAYVADHWYGLRIIDISNPTNPQEVGFYDTGGWAERVTVSENYAYIGDDESGLRVIDVSNPANPYEVGYYIVPGSRIHGAAVSNGYIYATGFHMLILRLNP